MKIRLFGVIDAEGEPDELSLFASLTLYTMKQAVRMEEKQEMDSAMNELMRTIDESMSKAKQNQTEQEQTKHDQSKQNTTKPPAQAP